MSLKLREGKRVKYIPTLWDRFTCDLPTDSKGTITKVGAWFGYYKDPGRKYVNVRWDNGRNCGVSKDSLYAI
jgi:hypothetical protein